MWSLYERKESGSDEEPESEEELPFRERQRLQKAETKRKLAEELASETPLDRADRKKREREERKAEAKAEVDAEKHAPEARGSGSDSDDDDSASGPSSASDDDADSAPDSRESGSGSDDGSEYAPSLDSDALAAIEETEELVLEEVHQRLAFAKLLLEFGQPRDSDEPEEAVEAHLGEEHVAHEFLDEDTGDALGSAPVSKMLVVSIGMCVPLPEPEPEPEPVRLSAQEKAEIRERERAEKQAAKLEFKRLKAEQKAMRQELLKDAPPCFLLRPAPVWDPGQRHAGASLQTFLIQNSSFSIQNSSFSMQTSVAFMADYV